MANLRIAPLNHVDSATLTSDSETPTLPVTYVQNVIRSKYYRSLDNPSSPFAAIKGAWANPLPERRINCMGVFRHNSFGGYRLRLFPNNNWTGTPIYDSGVGSGSGTPLLPAGEGDASIDWGDATGGANPELYPTILQPYVSYFPLATAVKSFQFDMYLDNGGHIEIGRFFLGTYMEATFNPKLGTGMLGWATNSEQTRTRGGSLLGNEGEWWRTLSLDLEWIDEGQRAAWMDIMRKVGTTRDFIITMFAGDDSRLERDYTMNAKFKSLDAVVHATNAYRSKKIVCEEC